MYLGILSKEPFNEIHFKSADVLLYISSGELFVVSKVGRYNNLLVTVLWIIRFIFKSRDPL